MSFRFSRRKRIAPGISMNWSKSGASFSFGPRGLKTTIGPRGIRGTVGLPGSGLYYTKQLSSKTGRSSRRNTASQTHKPLELGWLARKRITEAERNWVDGCRELIAGREERAISHLVRATSLADGAYLAGFLQLKNDRLDEAEANLEKAARAQRLLGALFEKYQLSFALQIAITEHIRAEISPDLRGVLLGLVECYQARDKLAAALAILEELHEMSAEDIVVLLSLTEVLLSLEPSDDEKWRRIVELTHSIQNVSPVHATLVLYRAQALSALGLHEAALRILHQALRRKKGYPAELLLAIRYERAQRYAALGQNARSQSDLERIFAEDPGYRDVAMQLGLADGKEKPKAKG